jgi:hypothetical protein
MTHAEQILAAAADLVRSGKRRFSRRDIRDALGIGQPEWMSGYTAIFQAMREDHPGGAPPIGREFGGVSCPRVHPHAIP